VNYHFGWGQDARNQRRNESPKSSDAAFGFVVLQKFESTNRTTLAILDSETPACEGAKARSLLAAGQRKSHLNYSLGLLDVHTRDGARNDETLDLTGPFKNRVSIGVARRAPVLPWTPRIRF